MCPIAGFVTTEETHNPGTLVHWRCTSGGWHLTQTLHQGQTAGKQTWFSEWGSNDVLQQTIGGVAHRRHDKCHLTPARSKTGEETKDDRPSNRGIASSLGQEQSRRSAREATTFWAYASCVRPQGGAWESRPHPAFPKEFILKPFISKYKKWLCMHT